MLHFLNRKLTCIFFDRFYPVNSYSCNIIIWALLNIHIFLWNKTFLVGAIKHTLLQKSHHLITRLLIIESMAFQSLQWTCPLKFVVLLQQNSCTFSTYNMQQLTICSPQRNQTIWELMVWQGSAGHCILWKTLQVIRSNLVYILMTLSQNISDREVRLSGVPMRTVCFVYRWGQLWQSARQGIWCLMTKKSIPASKELHNGSACWGFCPQPSSPAAQMKQIGNHIDVSGKIYVTRANGSGQRSWLLSQSDFTLYSSGAAILFRTHPRPCVIFSGDYNTPPPSPRNTCVLLAVW